MKGWINIEKIVQFIVEILKNTGIEIIKYEIKHFPSGQNKTIVYLNIENEKDFILKIVDVTPEMMLEDCNDIRSEDIRNEIIWKSRRIFNEIEMNNECSNLPQLRKIENEHYKYVIIHNKAYMYYIEEKIEGNMLNYKDNYTISEVIDFLEQMTQHIKTMSRKGYIHRDIKPSNIIEYKGKYFLIDGGLCKKMNDNENITRIGAFIGTPRYLAPEQEKVADKMHWTFQTDLYPIGIIITEMYIPETRKWSSKDIRDIQMVAKVWMMNRTDEKSIHLFKRIIANLLNEIRALRFNSIDELISEIEKIKKEVIE